MKTTGAVCVIDKTLHEAVLKYPSGRTQPIDWQVYIRMIGRSEEISPNTFILDARTLIELKALYG